MSDSVDYGANQCHDVLPRLLQPNLIDRCFEALVLFAHEEWNRYAILIGDTPRAVAQNISDFRGSYHVFEKLGEVGGSCVGVLPYCLAVGVDQPSQLI